MSADSVMIVCNNLFCFAARFKSYEDLRIMNYKCIMYNALCIYHFLIIGKENGK